MRAVLAVIAVAAAATSAHAGGGAFGTPPVEVDVGMNAPVRGDALVGTEVLAGVHWASLYWKPTPFEIGIGYVGSFRPLVANAAAREAMAPQARFELDGGYLTLGHTLYNTKHVRTWCELRGELMRGELADRTFSVLGGAVRIASELYVQHAEVAGDHGGGGAIAGTLAIGIYVEASHRDIPRELGATGVTTGLSVRLPLLFLAWN